MAERQRSSGGDREVGGKLGYYLKNAGCVDLNVQTVTVTSEQIPMKMFLDIVTGFKYHLVPEDQRATAKRHLGTIYRSAMRDGTFASCGAYVVAGRRPRVAAVAA